jgi:hypothetical protein
LVQWCLRPFPTIFQLYRGSQFYWWGKPEYPEKTTELQIPDKCYHMTPRPSWIWTHNISGEKLVSRKTIFSWHINIRLKESQSSLGIYISMAKLVNGLPTLSWHINLMVKPVNVILTLSWNITLHRPKKQKNNCSDSPDLKIPTGTVLLNCWR